jgi:hypothetical protein
VLVKHDLIQMLKRDLGPRGVRDSIEGMARTQSLEKAWTPEDFLDLFD